MNRPHSLPSTYCNPIPLPDYPRGRLTRTKDRVAYGWMNRGQRRDFRETADPSVLFHDGKWYLYPSCGMAWVSEDFCAWTHVPMNLDDIGQVYLSESPLGPFRYAARNPFLSDGHGLVRGPGHGCIVRGPRDTLWAFYTCTVGYHHIFERRIGLDPAGFDDQGNLFVRGASETPQFAPGFVARPQDRNDAGLLPLGINVPVQASSEAPGRAASYANDHGMRTWWQPAGPCAS